MLPGWDRLQDLRSNKAKAEAIPVATVPRPLVPLEQQIVVERAVLGAVADKLEAQNNLRAVAKNIRDGKMSKLGDIADRIKDKKLGHDRKADEWADRLNALDARE